MLDYSYISYNNQYDRFNTIALDAVVRDAYPDKGVGF